jgi:hypothetical protein
MADIQSPTPAPAPAKAPVSPAAAPAVSDFKPDTAETTPPEDAKPEPRPAWEGKPLKNRVPSNWHIVGNEEGIEASNSVTGETFVGTIAEFNQALRG